jgi:hypothetical protein
MKVFELIEVLKTFPQDLDVVIDDYDRRDTQVLEDYNIEIKEERMVVASVNHSKQVVHIG